MKVKQIMADAARLCGRQDIAEFLERGQTENLSAAQREEETLLRCYNLAENEIALDYLPLEHTEVLGSDGFVAYAAFAFPPVEIVRACGAGGERLPFTVAEKGIRVREGKVAVTYSYRPRVKTAADEPETNSRAGARVLALGTACEYALMSGMLESAELLDRRYRDAIACACRERGGRLKMRRWA
ncbi:MAG TPA: hypothetical protein H9729_02280 [Candidatus Borkfalkia excrementigallinarum]|uniref:Uncharacterized protein n=1 Tax=Candidatus Borkfalkia excrementigallinarum TaxID=2838506 RepID=A0A9D1ZW06_9FIRM|nr:hypothetical protein [Candidatus Borkfalkia excrementigallinarum]